MPQASKGLLIMSVGVFKGPEKFVPKLIFTSKTGRTEVSTRPDGAVQIDLVANTKDQWEPDEVARLIARLTAWQEEAR